MTRTQLFLLFILVISPLCRAESALRILINESISIQTLSHAQVSMIFAGRTQFWPNGERVRVFVLAGSHRVHSEFCQSVLQIYPYQLERIWQRITYSGQGDAPVVVNSIQEMKDIIAATPGAIGYTDSNLPAPAGTYYLQIEGRE